MTYLPDNECVVVLTTEGSQVLLIVREGKALNEDFMKLHALHDFQGVEIPDDDVRLHRGKMSVSQIIQI